MSLITQLKQISDPRHLRGRRHQLWVILFLILLGFLCGYSGYRPLASFCRNHEPSLRLLLALPDDQPLPRIQPFDVTFFRLHQNAGFQALTTGRWPPCPLFHPPYCL